jgi:hypothetical protein
MVQIYYEITIYIYKAIFPSVASPPNPHWGTLSPKPPLRARFLPDPAGGASPPALPHMEECTFFQGVKSSWGTNTTKNKCLLIKKIIRLQNQHPHPNTEAIPRMPRTPFLRSVHNPHARVARSYGIIDDLAQSPVVMSIMEVLQTLPFQRKALLSQLGAVDPADTRLITFHLDREDPRLPSLVAFQIPVKIRNIIVHRCIIDEGASTYIMSKTVWQQLGSPKLIPSTITLRAYDGRPSQPEGMYQNNSH